MPTRLLFAALLGVPLGSQAVQATHEAPLASYHADAVFDAASRRLHGTLRLTIPGRLLRDRREIRLDLAAGGKDADGERLTLGSVQASRAAEITREEATLVVTSRSLSPPKRTFPCPPTPAIIILKGSVGIDIYATSF